MGEMNLFTSNAMGAMDDTTQRRAKRTVYMPTIKAIPYMLHLQYLNHLGSAMLTPYGNLRLMEPLVHHHRLLNYYQPRFGWKYMPYPTELQVSPIHYICAMTSKCCHLRVYYIDDARCRTITATHVHYAKS
jgi:hypothetical protein